MGGGEEEEEEEADIVGPVVEQGQCFGVLSVPRLIVIISL